MHRSGTSLLAAWLEECGLVIDRGRRVGPAKGNPRGHFEDWDIVRLQRAAIYQRQGDASLGWKIHEPRPLSFPVRIRLGIAKAIAIRSLRTPVWGWKDPRSALFLHEWQRMVPGLRTLIVWRPASEVVASLERRSAAATNLEMKVAAGESLDIWRSYNRLLIDHARSSPEKTIVVRLSEACRRPDKVFAAVNRCLGGKLVYKPIDRLFENELLTSEPGPSDPLEAELNELSL